MTEMELSQILKVCGQMSLELTENKNTRASWQCSI